MRLLAEHRQPRQRKRRIQIRYHIRQSGFAHHHARAPDRVRQHLVVARQGAQSAAGFLVEVMKRVGGDVGIEPIGFREDDVEGNDDGAEPGQMGDEIRDPCSRPRPLAKFRGQAPFIDIDDGDRPCGLHARVDALEGIEGPDAKFLDRGGIGDAQRRKPDQERQAYQPRKPEPALEPTPQ